jgi:hypothetical protein
MKIPRLGLKAWFVALAVSPIATAAFGLIGWEFAAIGLLAMVVVAIGFM